MIKIRNIHVIKFLSILALIFFQSCAISQGESIGHKWTCQESILSARGGDYFDNVAVKDPSIVFYEGRYHLFYTAKSVHADDPGSYHTGCGYVSAASLQELNLAKRINIDSLAGRHIIAPQVFYFEPGEQWYLIAHSTVQDGDLSRLVPVYMTNRDLDNPEGWSKASEILTGRKDHRFWIDFWLICDAKVAYLFYSGQDGSVSRLQCPLSEFPDGFIKSKPERALHVSHMDEEEPWRMFEAVHIYYVEKVKCYLALLEGAYKHPVREGDVDARTRFIFGMTADSLDGEWRRVGDMDEGFLAEAKNVFYEGEPPQTNFPISHPELIRSGYDHKLVIDDFKLEMVFQSFDTTGVPDTYSYNELPWELAIMRNY